MKLTQLQRRFVEEFLIDLNATHAAIRAGYSPRTAAQQACRLFRNVKVVDAIAVAQEERSKRTRITADKVLAELGHIAFGNITDVVDWKVDVVGMIEDPETGKQRLATRNEVTLRSADDLPPQVKAAIARVRQDSNGAIEIKMHDKLAALVNLGRHLGLFAPVTRENSKDTPDRRIGKKEQQAIDAEQAAEGSEWGDDLDRPPRKPH